MAYKKKLELYFHIPFCARKCLYCDFLSAPADEDTQRAYMEALLAEMEGRADEYRDYRVSSVFIGGGTPSIIANEWVEKLLFAMGERFALQEDAEITIEVNPGTVDEEKLLCYKKAGINRLSIGLQSASDEELEVLGRIHHYGQFLETYEAARRAGFDNVNVDVMSALPGQSMESYEETLYKLIHLKPEHISAYSLIVEEKTPFYEMWQAGTLRLPDEDCDRRMYERTKEILGAAGFERYEISNYAKEGYACRHNMGYWQRTDYIGFGIGAASLFENRRFRNGDSLKNYLAAPLLCREEESLLTVEEQMAEFLFLGLRMTRGVSYERFQQVFNRDMEQVYGEVIIKNREDGLLREYTVDSTKERFLALTDKGIDVSNYVMAQFL
ncbi:MAG: radical SAM family heme chaperone HemW [Lachnoclostridium sp.]|nr:radical SAM family heme chaperone HemW [Lachnospira sp.]MCM1247087.1 radical SAM family heme chaperone HemW [Lachnoclostridium sp.]MCM1536064.1 radical SAM family heme chaperone HemW [Clostridium sp.]